MINDSLQKGDVTPFSQDHLNNIVSIIVPSDVQTFH